ncbi:hypothetical protein [Streptomyces amakusaensis]|uniref:Uncharacterized protein n=1 Tax=Streptomyces amakusaensis TaxID=67271 RepID=A0ABW0ATG4_9ACTN
MADEIWPQRALPNAALVDELMRTSCHHPDLAVTDLDVHPDAV